MSDDSPRHVPAAPTRWVAGLRRGWITSDALARWVDDRGVTGVVWTPASYEVDDAADAMASLMRAGAKPDKALLWDLALEDIRDAADELREVYAATSGLDGFVTVWIDPARASDPTKAVAAASEIVADVRRANVAVGLAWMPQRAAVVSELVKRDCPIALAGVRDDTAVTAVAAARTKGMTDRRAELTKDDPEREVHEVPVFLLGSSETRDDLLPIDVVSEFQLVGSRGPGGRLPLTPDAEQSAYANAIERLAARARLAAHDDDQTPEGFAQAVVIECKELAEDELVEDIWARDHTVWKDDPTEIADRLGWLDVTERMADESKDIAEFARRTRKAIDATHVVLCGMGGSSLGAETLVRTLSGGISFTVLDTTHPDHIASVVSSLDLEKTVFVIASKSGTTVETRSHMEYLWSLLPKGDHFVAVTDPGSELAKVASDRGFARVFENPADIGGRYSVLSYFGLVPAALAGVDIDPVLAAARRSMVGNAPGAFAPNASGARLAAAMSQAVRTLNQDKLTLAIPPALRALGPWIEQLIAESTGKEGKGILPVVGEPLGGPEVYGDDRQFVVYAVGSDPNADGGLFPPQLESLEEHPIVKIRVPDTRSLGAEFFRWEMATAITGYELDINPFDQPDVEAAKVRAREALSGSGVSAPDRGDARALLEGLEPPRYVAIQAYLPPTDENASRLEAVRVKLRDTYHVAVTTGFGPRFLHSTGQYHKGGPPTGVFLQVTGPRTTDIDVPGAGYSFGKLIDAQADGDLNALRDLGRDAARLSLEDLERLPS